jgi:ribokinase
VRIAGAIPGCALIKPDRVEAAALSGLECETTADAVACAEALIARGADRVVVSLGADGLVFADGERHIVLPALPATVVDVTGAGDAMLAAAFLGVLQGLPPVRYLEAGRLAAALTCGVRGAVSPAVSPRLFDE